jgi:hypothetical protein
MAFLINAGGKGVVTSGSARSLVDSRQSFATQIATPERERLTTNDQRRVLEKTEHIAVRCVTFRRGALWYIETG